MNNYTFHFDRTGHPAIKFEVDKESYKPRFFHLLYTTGNDLTNKFSTFAY